MLASAAGLAAAPGPVLPNPFGLQLRPPPASAAEVGAPAVLTAAPTNETCLVARRDGTIELYAVAKPASDRITVRRTRDGGFTWSEPELAFPLPGKAYYAVMAFEAPDGAVHAVVHLAGEGPGGYRGRLYEVHHFRRAPGAAAWSAGQRIVPGYVGSINGFIARAGGQLVLAVGRAVPGRERAPARGPDFGWNDTFIYTSEDGGSTWSEAPRALQVPLPGPGPTRYGAIEPTLLELRDGRVWMLIRDRGGRLWQSFSRDARAWSEPERTAFISSDSPADLLRLRDGRILLLLNACQNASDPRSYALGGREVLQALVSSDEGRTWRGGREIFHETNLGSKGDRGTAYASVVETPAGNLLVVSGQGEGKRAIFTLKPAWLEERAQRDELALGAVHWTQYGATGLRVERPAGEAPWVALPAQRDVLSGATWNFPLATSAGLELDVVVPPGVRDLRLALSDHFNRVDDIQAAETAVFAVPVPAGDGWRPVRLRWQRAASTEATLAVRIGEGPAAEVKARRPAQLGLNYLRVEFRSDRAEGVVGIRGLRVVP